MTGGDRPFRRYDRGDVVWVDFGFPVGSELQGVHPAIIIGWNDTKGRSTATVIPLTSRRARPGQAEVDLGYILGSETRSTALVHQVRSVSKLRFLGPAGHVGASDLNGIDRQVVFSYVSVTGGIAQSQAASASVVPRSSQARPGPLVPKRSRP